MRVFDIGIAAIALLITFPLTIGVAIAVLWRDGRPLFFYQDRVGKDLKTFKIVKFRTMKPNPEGAGIGASAESDLATKELARAAFKTTDAGDPRITRVGQVLRAYHLDELPQIINVLKGDMSMVGVRPDTPAQEIDYDPTYWKIRHSMRPGLTGPAQVGAKGGGIAERNRLELVWLSNPTTTAYFATLFRTIAKVAARSSF